MAFTSPFTNIPGLGSTTNITSHGLTNPWPDGSTNASNWSALSPTQQAAIGTKTPNNYVLASVNQTLKQSVSSSNSTLNAKNVVQSAVTRVTDGLGITTPAEKSNTDQTALTEDQMQLGYKVRLFAVRNFPSSYVVFEASPTVSESRSVEYAQVAPVHMPGSIQVYKRTGSRTFGVRAKLISRNTAQATKNMEYLQRLRGWTMPYFGVRDYALEEASTAFAKQDEAKGISNSTPGVPVSDSGSMLGAPPDVLYFYAYSSSVNAGSDRSGTDGRVNLKKIPVVLTNLSIDYPDDVDYIPVEGTGEPFPVKMEISIELLETHAPADYENFSLSAFKQGNLVQF